MDRGDGRYSGRYSTGRSRPAARRPRRGCLPRGEAIPHAVEGITRAARNCQVGYVTNNSSRTAAAVAKQLRGYGLNAVAEDIITSPQAAVRLLVDLVPSGSTVLAIGGDGLSEVLHPPDSGPPAMRATRRRPWSRG